MLSYKYQLNKDEKFVSEELAEWGASLPSPESVPCNVIDLLPSTPFQEQLKDL